MKNISSKKDATEITGLWIPSSINNKEKLSWQTHLYYRPSMAIQLFQFDLLRDYLSFTRQAFYRLLSSTKKEANASSGPDAIHQLDELQSLNVMAWALQA